MQIKSQADLDKAVKTNPYGRFEIIGAGISLVLRGAVAPTLIIVAGARVDLTVEAGATADVTAWENSTVTAWENSTVTARENSTVTAWGNSTVTARENSTVTARGYVFVRAFSAKAITASENCVIADHGISAEVTGGIKKARRLKCPAPSTPQAWCDHYGVEVKGGVATVFKAVNADWTSPHGYSYAPGTVPVAHDWDGGREECGGGLHFSPHPEMAREFHSGAKKFLGCPVALTDISVHPNASMPQKIKARGLCAPAWECDLAGAPVVTATEEAA